MDAKTTLGRFVRHLREQQSLTQEQLAAAPVVASLDTLLIDDLTDDEDDAFAAALDA